MTKQTSKRIDKIEVRREVDTDGDTSMLGEYSDKAGEYAIVARGEHTGEFVDQLPCECEHSEDDHNNNGNCMENCDCEDFDRVGIERGREYRYFNPSADKYEGELDDDIRKYCLQDFERMQSLDRGDWCYTGVVTVAHVVINGHCQRITGGLLWGVESDSDESYFREIADENLGELRDQLHAIGFSKRAIAAAMRSVEYVNE